MYIVFRRLDLRFGSLGAQHMHQPVRLDNLKWHRRRMTMRHMQTLIKYIKSRVNVSMVYVRSVCRT